MANPQDGVWPTISIPHPKEAQGMLHSSGILPAGLQLKVYHQGHLWAIWKVGEEKPSLSPRNGKQSPVREQAWNLPQLLDLLLQITCLGVKQLRCFFWFLQPPNLWKARPVLPDLSSTSLSESSIWQNFLNKTPSCLKSLQWVLFFRSNWLTNPLTWSRNYFLTIRKMFLGVVVHWHVCIYVQQNLFSRGNPQM